MSDSQHPSISNVPFPASVTSSPAGELSALLGKGTQFSGKLFFDKPTRIDGSFQGEIHGNETLVLGADAQIKATILVANCIVLGGSIEGDILAKNSIELYAPARVKGTLHAPAIFIDRGAQFDGSCKMEPLDEKACEALK